MMVTVRQVANFVEIWLDDQRIALHEKSSGSGYIKLKGQYDGLAVVGGATSSLPLAKQNSDTEVEQRPLAIYERLAGVGA